MPIIIPDSPPTLGERTELTLAMENDYEIRSKVLKRVMDQDKGNSTQWFINMFGWIRKDAKIPGPRVHLPFILYPYQSHYIKWLEDKIFEGGGDGIVEKARQMGISWVTLAVLLKHWLFTPGFTALIGSRKEQYVDDGTFKSLFPRIRYMMNRLPGWMMPKGFDPRQHATHMRLLNPENDAELSGESSNEDFARGGNFHAIVYDEASFWPSFEASWNSSSESTAARIPISTPLGMNYFGRLRHARLGDGSFQFETYSVTWDQHPDRDKEWLEATRKRYLSEAEFQREVMLSYELSLTGVVYPHIKNVPLGSYPFEMGMELYVTWDFGIGDDTAIIWIARNRITGKFRIVDCYSNSGKPITWYIPIVTGRIPSDCPHQEEYGSEELMAIARHHAWGTALHFGDPAATSRELTTGRSVIDVLAEHGIYVTVNHRENKFFDRKTKTERGLTTVEGIHEALAEPVRTAVLNYRFPDRSSDAEYVTPNVRPVHNWASHYSTALEYFFVNVQTNFESMSAMRPEPEVNQLSYSKIEF